MAETDQAAHGGQLDALTREELNAHATERGVENPEALNTKDDVIAAIEATPENDEAREAREQREQADAQVRTAAQEQAEAERRQAELAAQQADPERVSVDNGPPLAQVAEQLANDEAPELIETPEEVQ